MILEQLATRISSERLKRYCESEMWRALQIGASKDMWLKLVLLPESAAEALSCMSDYASGTLQVMIGSFGAIPVSEERLLKELRRKTELSGAECRIGLRQLEAAGILFTVCERWGERELFMPTNSCLIWQRLFYPYKLPPLRESFVPVLGADYDKANSSTSFGRQMLYALSAIARTGMSYTAKGALPKKTIALLLRQLELGEEKFRPFADRMAAADPYPIEAAVTLEAAYELGLLDHLKSGLRLNKKRLKLWMCQSDEARENALMDWMLGKLILASCPAAMRAASLLRSLDRGIWHSLKRDQKLSSSGEEDGDDWLTIWLSLFCRAGWAELRDAMQGRERIKVFRLREWSRTVDCGQGLYIQPSGELLAEPSCCMEARWELELISERRKEDELTIYQLTPESLKRAATQGRTKSSVERFLLEASGEAELPDSVGVLLEEWLLGGSEGWDDAKSSDMEEEYPAFFKASSLPAAEWTWPHCVETPFLVMGSERIACELAPLTPSDAPLLPHLDKLPAMWHTQLRSYHASTRKELMQQAMRLETAVQLKLDGELVVFIPDEMDRNGADWTVAGRLQGNGNPARNRLSSEMWEEMRLLIPEGCS